MGLFNFLLTFIVGIVVVGVAWTLVDIAKEVAPPEIQGTTNDIVDGISFLKPSLGLEHIGYILVGVILLGLLHFIFKRRNSQ